MAGWPREALECHPPAVQLIVSSPEGSPDPRGTFGGRKGGDAVRPVTDLKRRGAPFEVITDMGPPGGQPPPHTRNGKPAPPGETTPPPPPPPLPPPTPTPTPLPPRTR